MDRREIIALLKPAGLPTIYGWYKPGHEPTRPYAVLHWLYSSDFQADGINFQRVDNWQIDLITDSKSERVEQAVRDALTAAQIRFTQQETNDEGADYVRQTFKFKTI